MQATRPQGPPIVDLATLLFSWSSTVVRQPQNSVKVKEFWLKKNLIAQTVDNRRTTQKQTVETVEQPSTRIHVVRTGDGVPCSRVGVISAEPYTGPKRSDS